MHYLRFIFGLLFIVFIILLLHIKNLPNTFRIECAIRTSVPAETLYNYIKDFENWSEWNTWIKEDSTMKLQFKNIGTENPSYSWDGKNGIGSMETISAQAPYIINQKINFEGFKSSNVQWNIKNESDSLKWVMEGNMNFFAKAFTVFKGSMETSIGPNYQKGLENIDRILSERLNDYRFELKGSSIIQKQFYLYLTFQKNNSALDSIISKGSNELYAYANKNNLDVSGSIFSIVPKTTAGAMAWTLGLPIKKPHFAKDTFIKSKVMPERKVLKGVHYGPYDNINRSWEKLNTEMELLNPKLLYYPLTIYIVNKKSDKDPLTWETQLLLPYK